MAAAITTTTAAVDTFTTVETNALSNGKIIWIINSNLNPNIVSGMEDACANYGITCVSLKDIQVQDGRPDVQGMRQIHEQIVAVLNSELPGWNG